MTTPCPYCATAITKGPVAICKGCGNPVAVKATCGEIKRFLETNTNQNFQTSRTPRRIRRLRMFHKI